MTDYQDYADTGKKIATYMKKWNVSKEEMAKRTGVSIETVDKWLVSKNKIELEAIMKVAGVLDTPWWILVDDGKVCETSEEMEKRVLEYTDSVQGYRLGGYGHLDASCLEQSTLSIIGWTNMIHNVIKNGKGARIILEYDPDTQKVPIISMTKV